MSQRLNKKIVQERLEKNQWAVYVTARELKVSHEAIYKYLRKYPDLKQKKDAHDQETVDLAELGLRSQVLAQEPWAIKFLLTTKGKERGYVERTELTGVEDKPIRIVIEKSEYPSE